MSIDYRKFWAWQRAPDRSVVTASLQCEHDWRYAGSAWQEPAAEYPEAQCDFSGYIESCSKCGIIRQIPV